MTNSKTRLRVARIAAGSVFLAGVSLTVVGTASALDLAVQSNPGGGTQGGAASVSISGGTSGETSGVDEGQEGGTTDDPGNTTDDPGNTTDDPGNTTDDPGNTTDDPGNTTDDPGNTTDDPGNTTDDPGNTTDDPGNGGNSGGNGGSTGGPDTDSTGGTGGETEDPQTCVLDESSVDCGSGADTDAAGTRPISQEKPKEELAKTGAAETTFLLVGAATMIAGGVGFRLLPRLATRRTVA